MCSEGTKLVICDMYNECNYTMNDFIIQMAHGER